jgi:hypothetical protein
MSKDEHEPEDQEGMVLLADGFHRAFIGLTTEWSGATRSVYDYDKCVTVLMRRDKMTEEEATEFMEFNVVGSYVGKGTPLFVRRMRIDEL